MKEIRLTTCLSDEETDKLGGQFLNASHFDILVSGEDADVYTPEGVPLIKFRHNVLPPSLVKAAYPALRTAAHSTDNRGMAAGIIPEEVKTEGLIKAGKTRVRRVKRDGTLSNTFETKSGKTRYVKQKYEPPERIGHLDQSRGGLRFQRIKRDGTLDSSTRSMKPVESGIIGYFDRNARFPYCRLTAFNLQEPEKFKEALPLIQFISEKFKELCPERWEAQMEQIRKTHPDFVIKNTAFTTITVNKNWQTAVHKDAGDFEPGFGVMTAFCAGKFDGCYLCFPKYRVAVNMRSRDLLLANVHHWHGNTPLVGVEGAYERISLVLYYRNKMFYCGSAADEAERAKTRERGDPLNE